MLTEICQDLRNWFDRDQRKWYGTFDIVDGIITGADEFLQQGQFYYIKGSLFNDGVYKYTGLNDSELTDESFEGVICSMNIPKAVQKIAERITAWCAKYGDIDSTAMSPYASESFGGYSYSKGGSASNSNGNSADWRKQFASELEPWRKI